MTDPVAVSWSDPVELTAAVFFGAALLRLAMPARQLAARLRLVMDGLLVSVALLLVSWVAVLRPIIDTAPARRPHPGPDARLPGQRPRDHHPRGVRRPPRPRRRRPRGPAAAARRSLGLLVFACGDSAWAYLAIDGRYASGGAVDAGWLIAFASSRRRAMSWRDEVDRDEEQDPDEPGGRAARHAAAVRRGRGRRRPRRGPRPAAGGEDDVRAWLRTLLILLMVARQVLALQENLHLTRTLERRVDGPDGGAAAEPGAVPGAGGAQLRGRQPRRPARPAAVPERVRASASSATHGRGAARPPARPSTWTRRRSAR